ncbi:MAG TPA: cysteine synthase [bacterium]|nr:cysteine synthase [bacterium]
MKLLDTIGNTPLLRLQRVLPEDVSPKLEIYAKAEWFNPGGSVKDRPAFQMIRDAEASGQFRKGQTLIDSTSGNTGIAYAMIGAALGFPVTLVMPGNVSFERKKIIRAYGAAVIYSDPLKGSDGAREKVTEIVARDPDKYFFPDQYSNPSNWKAHYKTTGPEIWRDTGGRVTHFVAGMGTSGTVMGTGRFLKEKNPAIRVIAVQPESFHGVEGLKNMDCSVPVKIYDPAFHDQKITLSTEPAYDWTRRLAEKEGFLVGLSSGAALYGALEAVKDLKEGVVVVVFPDGGDKYLSTQLWES